MSRPATSKSALRPLLKWAGGKRQLLPHLRRFYPNDFNRYIEPFFGSGAVFFDLWSNGRLHGRDVILIDSNPDLIGCYEAVRDQPGRVAEALEKLAEGHARDGRAHYYEVRDLRFNPERASGRDMNGRIRYTPALAAMLIYLNRTGFNGLYRVNSLGLFNVPAGRYERPKICDRTHLLAVAEALAAAHVRLVHGSFELAREFASGGDFLYVDPPYSPLSRTASFTAYTTQRFDSDAQRRLQRIVIELASRGCHLLVSNSTSSEIAALYARDPGVRAAGLRTTKVPARRAVNSNGARRGPVEEYLITNVTASRPAAP